jgi:subtilisin family serine protease
MPKIPFNSITTSLLVGFVCLLLSSCGGGSSDSASNNSAPTPAPTPSNSDPLLAYQWSIKNVGASAFSSDLPVAGNDMNVTAAWALGYTGKGIKVGIIDSGLDIRHEDLAANVDIANSYNFASGSSDPTPTFVGTDHGTSVAGIVGAVAFNGLGGRGVAYNARLRGYNLYWKAADGTTPLNNTTNESKALGNASYSADNDIFNASYGTSGYIRNFDPNRSEVLDNLRNLRGGKGALLVKSAGNNFFNLDAGADYRCAWANNARISCDDTNTDTANSNYNVMVVGAFNANGIKSSYSTAGASVWISAPGGEYGRDQSYFESPLNSADTQPAIVTTSLTGCKNDLSSKGKPNYANDLDSYGENPLAKDCQYTATFNGTSSAAPNASGVVALMLEANPNLGYRDIKYILAATAKRIHPNQEPVIRNAAPFPITLEQGWVQNSAGNWFSNWYGFGAINAGAAVNMAKSYVSYLPALQTSLSTLTVPATGTVPNTANGAALPFNMSNAPFNKIEYVQVGVNIAKAPVSNAPPNVYPSGLWCNQIELTSPSGTKSILMHALQGTGNYDAVNQVTYPQSALVDAMFLSNAFYGEPAKGTWILRVLDLCTGATSGTTIAGGSQQLLILNGN